MTAFVTVGSTRFDALITCVLSEPAISAFRRKGYQKIIVQCGNSSFEYANGIQDGSNKSLSMGDVEIELWKFKPTLEEEYREADLIIGHAGSGTILDVLRKRKTLIVVPNPTLLDNHQEELAATLDDLGYLKAATITTLPQVINELNPGKLKAFPPFDGTKFARIIDEAMGFV